MSTKPPWPSLGDTAFTSHGNLSETASVGWSTGRGVHAIGFKLAGDIAVQHALEHRADLDALIYPACYLYRHYLELALKDLAELAADLLDETPPKLNHDLRAPWRLVKRALAAAGAEVDTPDVEAAETMLDEWHELDPMSFTFRYPTERSGAPSLPSDLRHMNIRQVADAIAKLDGFLIGADGFLANALDAKADMKAR